jgi:hypothetical protein
MRAHAVRPGQALSRPALLAITHDAGETWPLPAPRSSVSRVGGPSGHIARKRHEASAQRGRRALRPRHRHRMTCSYRRRLLRQHVAGALAVRSSCSPFVIEPLTLIAAALQAGGPLCLDRSDRRKRNDVWDASDASRLPPISSSPIRRQGRDLMRSTPRLRPRLRTRLLSAWCRSYPRSQLETRFAKFERSRYKLPCLQYGVVTKKVATSLWKLAKVLPSRPSLKTVMNVAAV